jgi:hypothetical protein
MFVLLGALSVWYRGLVALTHRSRDDGQVVALKNQHKQECKGLIIQIKYLKAKYTRESTMRSDLGFQKHYLLVLLSRFESS